jgi:CO dehydrogenase maturation factor
MKIAISGKGGSGKTTLAGNLARAFGRRGHTVVAIDADPNPNLATTLGVPNADPIHFLSHALLEESTTADGRHVERLKVKGTALLSEFGLQGPDGSWLVTVGTVEHADTGCNCSFHSLVRGLLTDLSDQSGWVSVTDMEAGLEHLKRGTVRSVDALLVLIEPYYRSLETGTRLQRLARELGVPRIYAVGNKVRDSADASALSEYCRRHELELIAAIPYDEVFQAADRGHVSASDLAREPGASPGLAAIGELAYALERRLAH